MAMPVEFREFTPKDSRGDLIRRLQDAPEEHAEALLASYELLQRLHDKGLIDVANGLLSASDTVVDRLVALISSKQAVTGLRLALMMSNLLENIDPDKIHDLLSGPTKKPESLIKIGKEALSEDARAGMSAAVGMLNILGEALRKQKTPEGKH